MNFKDALDGYLKCALWSSTDVIDGEDVYLDAGYEWGDGTVETLTDDLRAFYEEWGGIAERAGWSSSQFGHDFWLTRNHHGAGFWDRGTGRGDNQTGDELTAASHVYGECNLYLGDDGKVYANG